MVHLTFSAKCGHHGKVQTREEGMWTWQCKGPKVQERNGIHHGVSKGNRLFLKIAVGQYLDVPSSSIRLKKDDNDADDGGNFHGPHEDVDPDVTDINDGDNVEDDMAPPRNNKRKRGSEDIDAAVRATTRELCPVRVLTDRKDNNSRVNYCAEVVRELGDEQNEKRCALLSNDEDASEAKTRPSVPGGLENKTVEASAAALETGSSINGLGLDGLTSALNNSVQEKGNSMASVSDSCEAGMPPLEPSFLLEDIDISNEKPEATIPAFLLAGFSGDEKDSTTAGEGEGKVPPPLVQNTGRKSEDAAIGTEVDDVQAFAGEDDDQLLEKLLLRSHYDEDYEREMNEDLDFSDKHIFQSQGTFNATLIAEQRNKKRKESTNVFLSSGSQLLKPFLKIAIKWKEKKRAGTLTEDDNEEKDDAAAAYLRKIRKYNKKTPEDENNLRYLFPLPLDTSVLHMRTHYKILTLSDGTTEVIMRNNKPFIDFEDLHRVLYKGWRRIGCNEKGLLTKWVTNELALSAPVLEAALFKNKNGSVAAAPESLATPTTSTTIPPSVSTDASTLTIQELEALLLEKRRLASLVG